MKIKLGLTLSITRKESTEVPVQHEHRDTDSVTEVAEEVPVGFTPYPQKENK